MCDIFDAAPKGDMASMAQPIFSLSTKPYHRVRRYEDGTGRNYLEVKPSSDGLATIHDRDVLIYCIGKPRKWLKREKPDVLSKNGVNGWPMVASKHQLTRTKRF